MLENEPLEIINDLSFSEEDGKTTITFSGGPVNASDEEISVFNSMQSMLKQGFGGTFEQLDQYLASQQ